MSIVEGGNRDTGVFTLGLGDNAPSYHHQHDAPGSNLRDILDFLRRQSRLILFTAVTVAGLAIVGALVTTPIYSATGLVLVDPNRRSLLDPALRATDPSADSARVGSDVEIMRSDRMLLKVIGDENLATDDEFGMRNGVLDRVAGLLRSPPESPNGQQVAAEVLDRFRKAVSVQRRGVTNLIAVTVRSENPHKAARLANAITRAHIEIELQAKIDATRLEGDAIEAQIAQSRQDVVEAETALSGFISNEMERIVKLARRPDLEALRHEIVLLRDRKAEIATYFERVNESPLRAKWSTLHTGIEAPRAGGAHYQRFNVHDPISARETGTVMAASLRDDLAQVESRLDDARRRFSAAVLDSDLPSQLLADIYARQQSAANATRQFQTLLSRRQTLEAEASLQVPDSRVVSMATAPAKPSFPSLPLVATLATVLACGIGVGTAFLRENYSGGFTTSRQVGMVAGRRVGAVLPREAAPRGSSSLADTLVCAPFLAFCESIRRLRAATDAAIGGSNRQASANQARGAVVMVTSAMANEGKTTVALSLARAYALSGQSVILLDCDLRKPTLHRHLGVADSTGLVDVLTGKVADSDLSRILVGDPRSEVTSIVGARQADVPTDQLFATRSFGQIIASARESFDYVVIDAPPIEPVADSLYLARHADAIVFVVRWARTPQRAVVHALEQLKSMAGSSTNVVVTLNAQEAGSGAYGKSYASM